MARSGIEVVNALYRVGARTKIEVWVGGGMRRGTDIFQALILGAQAVGVDRPFLYGLAAYGQKGAEHVMKLFREELEMAMSISLPPWYALII